MTGEALSFLSTGLAGLLVGVGVAWGSLISNLRALTAEVHALRDTLAKQHSDHEQRLRVIETRQTENSLLISNLRLAQDHR